MNKLEYIKNILGPKAPGFPILLGLVLAIFYPYFALPLNEFTFYLLFALMFLSALQLKKFDFKISLPEGYSLLLGLFFCFCLLPAVTWLIGRFLIKDDLLLYGAFWATLCPVAIVAPFFVGRLNGSEELSFKFVVASTVAFPLFAGIMSSIFSPQLESINIRPFLIDIFALVSLPVIAALLISSRLKVDSSVVHKIRKLSPTICMILIGARAYIILGTTRLRINLSLISSSDWLAVGALAFVQDFLTFLILPYLLLKLIPQKEMETLRISLSMKNVVVAGSILGFYLPKAALPAVLVLFVHALFFGFLLRKSTR